MTTTSSRLLIEPDAPQLGERHAPPARRDQDIPDYPLLFTHEEILIASFAARLTGIGFGMVKKFTKGRDEVEGHRLLHPRRPRRGGRRRRNFAWSTAQGSSLPATSSSRSQPAHAAPERQVPTQPAHFDTLVMETTRGTTERTEEKTRGREMTRLVESINDTIKKGGSFLIPVFALGRMQEVLSIVHDARKVRPSCRLPHLRLPPRHGPRRLLRRDQPQDKAHPVQPRDREGAEDPPAPARPDSRRRSEAERTLYHKLRHARRAYPELHALASGLLGNASNDDGLP